MGANIKKPDKKKIKVLFGTFNGLKDTRSR
jgi:hypothetical protein